ncbi:MAG: hypothetical protein ABSH51_10345 [Solirubrobacteraceae bacterium]
MPRAGRPGRGASASILEALGSRFDAGVLENGWPTSVHERDGETIAFFAATIKDQPVDGVLRAVTDDEDRASDITLMVRPWAAPKAGIAGVAL